MNVDGPPADINARHPSPTSSSGGGVIAVRSALLDVIVGILMSLMALALWFGAAYIEKTTPGLRGPADFPRGIALIFGIVSLVMAARGALALRNGQDPKMATVRRPAAVLVSMVLVAVYPILLGSLGYYLTTGPWLLALLFVTGYRKLLPMVLCAVGFLIFTKAVFEMLIGIPLP